MMDHLSYTDCEWEMLRRGGHAAHQIAAREGHWWCETCLVRGTPEQCPCIGGMVSP